MLCRYPPTSSLNKKIINTHIYVCAFMFFETLSHYIFLFASKITKYIGKYQFIYDAMDTLLSLNIKMSENIETYNITHDHCIWHLNFASTYHNTIGSHPEQNHLNAD